MSPFSIPFCFSFLAPPFVSIWFAFVLYSLPNFFISLATSRCFCLPSRTCDWSPRKIRRLSLPLSPLFLAFLWEKLAWVNQPLALTVATHIKRQNVSEGILSLTRPEPIRPHSSRVLPLAGGQMQISRTSLGLPTRKSKTRPGPSGRVTHRGLPLPAPILVIAPTCALAV